MVFHNADYVLGAVTLVAAVLGLFGGFSGALGFCAGVVAAGAAGKFGYPYARDVIAAPWGAALAVLAATLLAFGIARAVVKRVVRGLLAQPADAIFGFLVAAVTGAGVSLGGLFAVRQLLGVQVESAVYALVLDLLW